MDLFLRDVIFVYLIDLLNCSGDFCFERFDPQPSPNLIDRVQHNFTQSDVGKPVIFPPIQQQPLADPNRCRSVSRT
jgi:hypothetical protein